MDKGKGPSVLSQVQRQCTWVSLGPGRASDLALRGQPQVLWEKGILRSLAALSDGLTCVKSPGGGPISGWSSGPVSPSLSFQSQSLWGLPRRESSSAGYPQPKHPATSQGECVLRLELVLEFPSQGFYCQLCCLRF